MKFAHFSDCHIGGWREEKLRLLSIQSFAVAVEKCLEEKVDFILIAGDLFNTSVPSIDAIKMVTVGMKKLVDAGVRIYVIPGSHDYSPSGKTMLEVLEKSGLCTIVFKFHEGKLTFTLDKTGTKLTGMIGLRGGLEKFDYMKLDRTPLEKEDGFKIFLFHSLITEFKPVDFEMVDSEPLMSLPKNFHYYAGGHPHMVFQRDMRKEGYGLMTYPGPLFPNNFKELEKLKHGGFYIVDVDAQQNCIARHIPVVLKKVVSVVIDAERKHAEGITKEIRNALDKKEIEDAIVTVRVEGCLREGKVSDIPFHDLFARCKAYLVLKNTYKLASKEFSEITIQQGSVFDVEEEILRQNMKQYPVDFFGKKDGIVLAKLLMAILDKEKLDGERVGDFEERVLADIVKELDLREVLHAD
ncbi:MAG: DNA repair exonuclease [Nanoarchaeota archaeon]